MPIFFNEEIYNSGVDYQIGGFETDKVSNITYSDIISGYMMRLSEYIEYFYEIAVKSYASQGYEKPQEAAMNALVAVVEDYLNIKVTLKTKETIQNDIFFSNQSQKWLETISMRFDSFEPSNVGMAKGITNVPVYDNELYIEAEEIMEDSSLQIILERLSTIEL